MTTGVRRTLWIVGVLVLLVGAALLYLKSTGTEPMEVVELFSQGGEKLLRDPQRPARGGPRVLILALDGVGDSALRTALEEGHMPVLAAFVGASGAFGADPGPGAAPGSGVYARGYAVPDVLSVLPSTTYAAWASLFTGRPPAETGVPGNEWFERETMTFQAPAPVSVTGYEHALEVYTDDLVGAALAVPTLYELADVRSYVVLSHVYRGADVLITPDPTILGDVVTAVAEGITGEDAVTQEAYAELDRAGVDNALSSMRERGVPDLQVVYFPGVDLFTHVAEQPQPDLLRYLREVVDPAVAEILEAYRSAAALDSTYVLVVSDHGHVDVLGDDRHALSAEGKDEPPALLEALGFRLRPFVAEVGDGEDSYQATVAYQGAFAYVYLADRSTCTEPGTRCDWGRPPRIEEDVLAVVRAFDAANRTGAGVPELRGTLDLILAREPRAPGQDALPFQVWDGEALVPVATYLAANPRPDLLELESRLEGLGAGPQGHRAGDVLLLARSGVERPLEERFYFSSSYRSWHGSPSAQESIIALLVAHQGQGGEALRARVHEAVGERPSQLDVVDLVLNLLERR